MTFVAGMRLCCYTGGVKQDEQIRLLHIARNAIAKRFASGTADLWGGELSPELMEPRATFVTLTIGGSLRGCIGMLEAVRPMAEDVAANAVAAAFEDPRFAPLSLSEVEQVKISISVLSPPEEITFSSEEDLLEQIRPGVDGLILKEGFNRGTFLPSVWEELPEKNLFFEHLKRKAGLPFGYWSDSIRVYRYTTEYFSE
jgi:AmmeMemoRadiSam system protein A